MGKDIDHPQSHQRGKPHGGAHVIAEHQERARVGEDPSVKGHAACNRGHGVLADSEVHVPPSVAPLAADRAVAVRRSVLRLLKVAAPLEPGQYGRIEVCRASHKLRQDACEVLHDALGGLARGHVLGLPGIVGKGGFPSLGEFALDPPQQFSGRTGIVLGVMPKGLLPGLLHVLTGG